MAHSTVSIIRCATQFATLAAAVPTRRPVVDAHNKKPVTSAPHSRVPAILSGKSRTCQRRNDDEETHVGHAALGVFCSSDSGCASAGNSTGPGNDHAAELAGASTGPQEAGGDL